MRRSTTGFFTVAAILLGLFTLGQSSPAVAQGLNTQSRPGLNAPSAGQQMKNIQQQKLQAQQQAMSRQYVPTHQSVTPNYHRGQSYGYNRGYNYGNNRGQIYGNSYGYNPYYSNSRSIYTPNYCNPVIAYPGTYYNGYNYNRSTFIYGSPGISVRMGY